MNLFHSGANGLNLTEAQHVILIEPQLHRSVEFQAIARVRRLGQQHETYVYRVCSTMFHRFKRQKSVNCCFSVYYQRYS